MKHNKKIIHWFTDYHYSCINVLDSVDFTIALYLSINMLFQKKNIFLRSLSSRSLAYKTKKCSLFYFVRVVFLIIALLQKKKKKKEMSRTFDTLCCLFIYPIFYSISFFSLSHVCNNYTSI
jgi:hypothetical protein